MYSHVKHPPRESFGMVEDQLFELVELGHYLQKYLRKTYPCQRVQVNAVLVEVAEESVHRDISKWYNVGQTRNEICVPQEFRGVVECEHRSPQQPPRAMKCYAIIEAIDFDTGFASFVLGYNPILSSMPPISSLPPLMVSDPGTTERQRVDVAIYVMDVSPGPLTLKSFFGSFFTYKVILGNSSRPSHSPDLHRISRMQTSAHIVSFWLKELKTLVARISLLIEGQLEMEGIREPTLEFSWNNFKRATKG
ncbi:hypothetical protein Tco_0766330 [Tanacetum coccineum]